MRPVVYWGDFEGHRAEIELHLKPPASTVAGDRFEFQRHLAQRSGQAPLAFIHARALQTSLDLDQEMVTALGKTRVILFYDDSEPVQIMDLVKKYDFINHVLPLRSPNTFSWIENFLSPRTEILKELQLEVDPLHLLKDPHQDILTHAEQCDQIYEKLGKYTPNLGCFNEFNGIIQVSASELLTNAFYNAKRDQATGKPKVSDRRIKFELDQGENIKFCFGRDDENFWLIVRDCFGTLNRAGLVNALNRAMTEKTARISNEGGAGLGLMMLYNWTSELNFFMKSGYFTSVACKFRLTPRNRVFESEPSSLHIYAEEDLVS